MSVSFDLAVTPPCNRIQKRQRIERHFQPRSSNDIESSKVVRHRDFNRHVRALTGYLLYLQGTDGRPILLGRLRTGLASDVTFGLKNPEILSLHVNWCPVTSPACAAKFGSSGPWRGGKIVSRRRTMQTTQEDTGASEAKIWSRLIRPANGTFSKAAAHAILAFNFTDAEKSRMQELAERNGEDKLSASEKEELEGYIRVANVLALLHAKARRSLKNR
jgi:hypothetical protein